jgi:type I restriction enzyme S subunit
MWEDQLPLCLYQNHLHRLRPIRVHSVEPAFYMYWMEAAWRLFGLYGGSANRTTIPNLSRSRLASFPVPLPPLAEQRAIAYVLRAVQRAREATERVIAAARTLKKSLMRHLFTYGAVPVEHAERIPMQDTELGPLPAHWQVVKLGEVVKYMKAGGTPKRAVQSYWGGDIPFVLIEDITRSGMFLKHTKETISEAGLRNSSAWIVPEGSVLLTMYRTIGLTAINEIPVATNQAILAIIPDDHVDSLFLAYLLRHEDKRLESQNVQSTQKNVSKQIVQRFPIPLPPLAEQIEIARILQAVDRKIEAEEARRGALEGLFKTLLHDLMTARRRLPREFVAPFAEKES